MGQFPWRASEMTWVHHRLFGACEMIISEKQSGKSTGRITRDITADTSRFDKLEQAFRAHKKT